MVARGIKHFFLFAKAVFGALISLTGLFPTAFADGVVADPHRFDHAIAAFEAADKASMPEPGKVLFLGSSSIRRWDTARAFPEIDSINRGFGGSQTSDCIYFFDRIVLPYKPTVIVLYEGDNDIGAGKSTEQVVKDFQTFAKQVRVKLPGTKIVYIPIKPSIKRASLWNKMENVNQEVQTMAAIRKGLYYADIATPMLATGSPPDESLFAKDGLHLSDKGNALWASVINPVVKEALGE
ncbi:MAG: hypothetical protein CMI17_05130 [Opitutaceae bacterium]|nr:hypothetical protein [Opitutaceae bacterium]|tara:strand:- start:2695 stop:3408 length:714 start_codon:yes stop_codon:yes gene_type:complete